MEAPRSASIAPSPDRKSLNPTPWAISQVNLENQKSPLGSWRFGDVKKNTS